MKRISTKRLFSLILGLIALISTGCAMNRSVVSVPLEQIDEPTQGTIVVINSVTDQRLFELDPELPSTPSLKDGAIGDKTLTVRAFARKRNTYGVAMGDVLLPEGESVATLVKQSLTNTLRATGYRVRDGEEDIPADALSLDVDIKKFWCWMEPGFWYITSNFQAELELRGPFFKSGNLETVEIKTNDGHQVITDNDYIKTTQVGLESLMSQIKEKLKEQ